MENIKQIEEKNVLNPKKLMFEPPMISVIHFTETDIITTSGFDDGPDYEAEKV